MMSATLMDKSQFSHFNPSIEGRIVSSQRNHQIHGKREFPLSFPKCPMDIFLGNHTMEEKK